MIIHSLLRNLRPLLCSATILVTSAHAAQAVNIVTYRMQESNPAHVSTALDSSGFGNNGTYLWAFGGPGSITNTNDHPVPAVNLGKQFNISNGTGAHIALDPNNASIAAATNSLSMEFLLRPQADTFTSGLLALYANNGPFNPGDLHLNISNSNLEFAVSGNPTHASVDLASLLPINEWGHVVVTYGAGSVSFYLNGDLIGSGVTAGTAANIHNAADIGTWSNGGISSRFFRGGLDEFSIYNTTLTADEVRQLSQAFQVQIPEPVILPVVALAFLAMSANRRRRLA